MDFGRVPVDFGHKRVLVLLAEPAPAGTGVQTGVHDYSKILSNDWVRHSCWIDTASDWYQVSVAAELTSERRQAIF